MDLLGPRGRRPEPQSADRYLPASLAGPAAASPDKRSQRLNNSLLREMWRAASSLELIPLQTKTQLGDALLAQWQARRDASRPACGAFRVSARASFSMAPTTRCCRAIGGHALGGSAVESSGIRRRLVAIARRTGDVDARSAAATIENYSPPHPRGAGSCARRRRRTRTSAKMFGEELPSGLVAALS